MMMRLAAACIALAACTVRAQDGFGTPDAIWQLTEIDGIPFDARATLTFPTPGRVSGAAPCNAYFGALTGTYPAFSAPVLAASKRACSELQAEAQFFAALRAVRSAKRMGDTLTLSDATGLRLVFTLTDRV